MTWTAPYALHVRSIRVWIGTDGAPEGQPFPAVDTYTSIYLSQPDGFLAAWLALDRYDRTPITPQDTTYPSDLAPPLPAGGQIGLGHVCQALFGAVSHSQTVVVVTFTKD